MTPEGTKTKRPRTRPVQEFDCDSEPIVPGTKVHQKLPRGLKPEPFPRGFGGTWGQQPLSP
jgi:hypothetical protein